MQEVDQHLVEPEALAARVATGDTALRVLDVRYSIEAGPLPEEYRAGHIPGAVFVDFERELSGLLTETSGNQPLPSASALATAIRVWGVRTHDEVVVVSGRNGLAAARAWWLLRWAGHHRVRLLDGGYDAWNKAGLPLSDATTHPPEGGRNVEPGGLPALENEAEVLELAACGQLIDARARSKFDAVDSDDPTAPPGRIPGAVSLPATSFVRRNGRRREPEEVIAALESRGVDPSQRIGIYCGGGVASSYAALVLHSIGTDPAIYPPAWSGWTARKAPVELPGD